MNRFTMRIVQLLLLTLFMLVGTVGPANAQSSQPSGYQKVTVENNSGWTAFGRHQIADDFVIVCPNEAYDLPGENHPCNNSSSEPVQIGPKNSFVLACPVLEVLEDHACAERRSQVFNARPKDLVLVCPNESYDLPGENHPCNQSASIAQFQMPTNRYVLTCPAEEVIEEKHPCAESNRSR